MPNPIPYTAKSGLTTWRVRFRHGGRSCSETFDTEHEARVFADNIANNGVDVALRILTEAAEDKARPTLDALAEQFFTYKARDSDVRSDRTVADYRRDYRNWVKPVLGSRRADKITERDVQGFVDAMIQGTVPGREKALSPKSVADRHMIVHSIYAWATSPARPEPLAHNPCKATKLPKRRTNPPKGLRPAEWKALYAALHQVDRDAADLALFLLASGWRFSEAAALAPLDVDDDGRIVVVTMGRVLRRNAAGQHVIVEDAKSEAGLRRVKLDADASAMVRRRLERADALVFTTALGSQWHYANFLNRAWNPAVKTANLSRRPTPHWLRHTAVYWLVASGKVAPAEIQRRLGHARISTTMDVYGRMIDDVSEEALEAFAAMREAPLRPSLMANPAQDLSE